ncbi:MAG: hypothetical protein JWM52_707 [Candidatus Saccharibacteria bacterium]|nr:hypothetical protein [Candidatus Saccharibacteria bacterium]
MLAPEGSLTDPPENQGETLSDQEVFIVTGIEFQYRGVMPIPDEGTVRKPRPVKFDHGILLKRAVRHEEEVVNRVLDLPANIQRTQRDDVLSPPGALQNPKYLHFWYKDGTTAEELEAFAERVFAILLEHEFHGSGVPTLV